MSNLERKRKEALEKINEWNGVEECCKRNCFHYLGTEFCRSLREEFLSLKRDQRKARLLDFVTDENNNQVSINGHRPCWTFLNEALWVSNQMVTNCRGLRSANASSLPGRMGGVSSSASKAHQVMAFLSLLADGIADEFPNSRERHLPHGSKQMVYNFYYEHAISIGGKPCGKPYFYHIWRKYRRFIKCRRNHGFSTCDTCIMFKERLLRLCNVGSFTSTERTRVMNGFKSHLHFVRNERAQYALNSLRPIDDSERAISVIIDCADQTKFGLPRFPMKGKRETGMSIKQKIAGVLFHKALGGEDFLCLFTSPHNLRGGANLTIDALCRGLFALLEAWDSSGQNTYGRTNLFIQLDNTGKDNKNRYFFSFCDYLIHIGVFESITVSFLPVGHTHEDIDRRFSYISRGLEDRAVCCLGDLHECLQDSQGSTKTHVARTKALNNFSGALEKQNCVQDIEGFQIYHKFSFKRDGHHDETTFKVACRAFLSMCSSSIDSVLFERRENSIGSFMKKKPNMNIAEKIPYKNVNAEELREFRTRIEKTETRINDIQKKLSLLEEIEWLENPPIATPEWKFSKIDALATGSNYSAESNHILDFEPTISEPNLSYESGQMVAVNCGSSATQSTPFWLGQVIQVESVVANSEVSLTVQWYEISTGCTQHQSAIVCFKGKYRPMLTNNQTPFTSTIPSSAVLVTFDSLTVRGTIPSNTQSLIKESLSHTC